MRIGITYDLKDDYLKDGFSEEEAAEFDKLETIDAIDDAIKAMGHSTDRIGNIKHLMTRLLNGDRWGIVFNIAEGTYGVGRESAIPCLLDAYKIPYVFSDPAVLAVTLHKAMTKHIVRDLKIPTADFFVAEFIDNLNHCKLKYPLFAKPVAEGTGKGITALSKINDSDELQSTVNYIIKEFNQPALVEEYLPGREFTIAVVGTGDDAYVLGSMEVVFKNNAESDIYSFNNKANYKKVIEYKKVGDNEAKCCADLALSVWKGLGCRDGGRVDIRMDSKGVYNFIEVNPLAGLNPIDSDMPIICNMYNIKYNDLIAMIMKSALKRILKL